MKKSKIGACALALATAAAICVPGTALADSVAAGSKTLEAAGTSDSLITGTITATKLSVSVPTTAAFTIDPTIEATDPSTQLTDLPTNYTVTNASAVPVYAYISDCTIAKAGTTAGNPTLVNKTADLATDYAVMFAVKDSAPANFDTPGDWLTGAGTYYAFNAATHGKLAAKSAADKASDASNVATMSFYGQTTTGWSNGDTFTITPTFTIATTDTGAAS